MSSRILIVDADRAFASELAAALGARGGETQICADGHDAVGEARSWAPDLVVVCVELPGLSGYSVCNKLKKDEQLRSIPLVLTSSEATEETFEQHRKLRTRADEYLLKPFTPDDLVRAIGGRLTLGPPATPSAPAPAAAAPSPTPGAAAPSASPALGAFGDDDLELIDRVLDEFAGSDATGSAPAGGPDAGARPAAAPPPAPTEPTPTDLGTDPDRLRTRVAELEAELARVRAELAAAQADQGRAAALQRAVDDAKRAERAASDRVAAAEARLRHADALREKARRALTVVLQALEESPTRAAPADVHPRRE